MSPEEFRRLHPDLPLFEVERPDLVAAWLAARGVLAEGEAVLGMERAGEGNMNCTLRVRTNQRSLILKQSRPWVEKYPQFEAPWNRTLREIEFYRLAGEDAALAACMPRVLHTDEQARAIVLEDLGDAGDYSDIYRGGHIDADTLVALGDFLGRLHRVGRGKGGLANRAMRALNAAHIFHIPLDPENGLDLEAVTPGLAAVAAGLANDLDFAGTVRELAAVYLADGPSLVHGDFFPGSILRSASGPKIIDPEFGFSGRPEFDPGVFVAHLLLAGCSPEAVSVFLDAYARPPGFEEALMLRFAGVEIMRRLIGYAQLPLEADLERKRRWLELARSLVLEPDRRLVRAD